VLRGKCSGLTSPPKSSSQTVMRKVYKKFDNCFMTTILNQILLKQFPRILALIVATFLLNNSYGQISSKSRFIDRFISSKTNTKIIQSDSKDNFDTTKFKSDLTKIDKSEMTIIYYTDTLSCETFDYYRIVGLTNKYFIFRKTCDKEMSFVILDSVNNKCGSIKYDSNLVFKFMGYRHIIRRNEILAYYTVDNVSTFYCLLVFYDDKNDVDIMFDKKGIVTKK
jgi:hypothetical protein